ncbi:hypothetical protein [Candidatus Enterococcus ferrettii]|uniref:Uncharacterized protein n=1 Tax=Candidatus Enterococcus ferrettii TaxID=2815324 RepID=A0ABV0ETN5_9ENTE|nr:hypothetical protein [Enterococcus sp. 665A]MBO1341110.1 hypothetical protein [Enterococcus sp. 665A]
MIRMERFGTIINIFVGVAVCLVLGLYIQYVNKAFTPELIFHGFVSSFFVSYVIGDLIPGKAWGDALAAKIGLKNGNFSQHLVSTIVLAFCMVTPISFLSTYVGVGPHPMLLQIWFTNYPVLLVLGYITLFLSFPLALKTAIYLTKDSCPTASD